MNKQNLPNWYFTTSFEVPIKPDTYPSRFMILTAWNPMNQELSQQQNIIRNKKLKTDLENNFDWVYQINGLDLETKHSEDGYMADCNDIDTACDYGLKYQQDAIY